MGSSQSVAYPATVLNTVVASSIQHSSRIRSRSASRPESPKDQAIQDVVSETLQQHRRVLFSGDNYAEEWRDEAESRGLPHFSGFRDRAIEQLTTEDNPAALRAPGGADSAR